MSHCSLFIGQKSKQIFSYSNSLTFSSSINVLEQQRAMLLKRQLAYRAHFHITLVTILQLLQLIPYLLFELKNF